MPAVQTSPPDSGTNAFHTTRSGSAFSPWFSKLGVPLHAPAEFRLHRAIDLALRSQEESATTWRDPDEDREVETPEHYIPQSTISAPPPLSPPAAQELTQHDPTGEAEPQHDASISKALYHRRQHKKKRRRENRARTQDPEMNRPMKSCAKARPQAPIGPPTVSISETAPPSEEGPRLTNLPHREQATMQDSADGASGLGEPLICSFSLDMSKNRVASTGYMGLQEKPNESQHSGGPEEVTVEGLMAKGFTYHAWDGITSHALLDYTGTWVIGALAGSPNDPTYHTEVNQALQDAFDEANDKYRFPAKDNRRGPGVRAISCGISFGGGQQRVGNLRQGSRANEEVVEKLVNLTATKRVANYGNAALQMFEPGVYKQYDGTLCALCERDPTLVRLFGKNAFASTTFNVGSQTVTCEHYDHLNLAYGACAITAIGKYNPKTSGHLILWDLRMIIEFPPMSTIVIPSAIVAHSNIPIGEHERRYSMTQYSAAGLFRWVDCGFQSKKALEESGGQLEESGREYWQRGVSKLSTWTELQANWGRVV